MIESRLDAGPATLLERSAELRAIAHALDDAADGRGRLMLIEGEPGIGKSSLVAAGCALAASRGLRVLHGAPGEMEAGYACGLVLDLFGRVLADPDERARALAGAASRISSLVEPATADGLNPADPFPLVHAVYWLTANLAEDAPLVLAVDDGQWGDDLSLRSLAYLAKRIADLPVALLVAVRPPSPDEAATLGELRRLGEAHTLRPQRLSLSAVEALLSSGDGQVDHAFASACHAATRGNPFYLHELTRQLEATPAIGPVSEFAPRLISHRVAARLDRLGPDAAPVAQAIAVLGSDATLERVAAVANLPLERAAAAGDGLATEGLVESRDGLAFVHPIVRTAVYRSLAEQQRALAHRRAAELLAVDLEEHLDAVATHLLASPLGGDAREAGWLLAAARSAAARGEPHRAIACLERGLRQSPQAERRAEVLVDLGRALATVGDAQRAATLLGEAVALSRDARSRAAILCEQGEALQAAGRWDAAASTFDRGLQALQEPGVADPALHGRLQAGFVAAAWLDRSQHDEAERRAAAILASPGGAADVPLVALWTAYQNAVRVEGGRDAASRLVHDAIDGIPIGELQAMGQAVELAAGALLCSDALSEDARLLTAAMREAQANGSIAKYAVASYCRAWPYLHAGRLHEAAADAQAAVDALDSGWEMFYPAACAVLALALLESGQIEAAAAAIDIDPARWGTKLDYLILVPLARGRVELAKGNPAAAAEIFLGQKDVVAPLGVRNPDMSNWRSWGAVALARLGRREEAVDLAQEELDIAREWGAPRQIGAALRALGVARGGHAGLEPLHEAVATLRRSPARLELVRATADLGTLLRSAGQRDEARTQLASAADLARRCGAALVFQRAAGELHALGARPRRYAVSGPDSLTPTELRVARLVAEGRTNREVAQALFVTLKAVEYHLGNVYPKLGIASRRELGAALGDTEVQSVELAS